MSKQEITTNQVADLAARAGIENALGHNFQIVARELNDRIDTIKAELEEDACEDPQIAAVALFELIAEATTYDRVGYPLQDRCDAGEFDTWAPIWKAA